MPARRALHIHRWDRFPEPLVVSKLAQRTDSRLHVIVRSLCVPLPAGQYA
jgi:hypothetical protein